MDCSWSAALKFAGLELERPDSSRLLAFAYTAIVSLRVEESCVDINPSLSLEELKVLTIRPDWLDRRPDWLKAEWPSKPVQQVDDLVEYGLTASKALLAVGAKIADGDRNQMLRGVADLFPECQSIDVDPLTYEAWLAHVAIEADGNIGWGYGGPLIRSGRRLPVKDADYGGRSSFEVFLQNQLRIDIQRRLECLSTC